PPSRERGSVGAGRYLLFLWSRRVAVTCFTTYLVPPLVRWPPLGHHLPLLFPGRIGWMTYIPSVWECDRSDRPIECQDAGHGPIPGYRIKVRLLHRKVERVAQLLLHKPSATPVACERTCLFLFIVSTLVCKLFGTLLRSELFGIGLGDWGRGWWRCRSRPPVDGEPDATECDNHRTETDDPMPTSRTSGRCLPREDTGGVTAHRCPPPPSF